MGVFNSLCVFVNVERNGFAELFLSQLEPCAGLAGGLNGSQNARFAALHAQSSCFFVFSSLNPHLHIDIHTEEMWLRGFSERFLNLVASFCNKAING